MGVFNGTEIMLGNMIAQKLGAHYSIPLTPQWVWVQEGTDFFGGLKAGLDANSYDAVLSSVTYTAARSALVDFSCQYYTSYLGLLRGPRDPSMNFTNVPAQLNSPSVYVGALGGTTGAAWVANNIPMATQVLFPNESALVLGVKNGQVHFGISDRTILAYGLQYQMPPCQNCTLLPGNYGTPGGYAMFTEKDPTTTTTTPLPSTAMTTTTTPSPPLKSGTVFSLFVIAFFCCVVVAGVVSGIYFQTRS